MGAITKAILEVLRKLYGSEFISKTIGTRANVVKPKEFDINAPTKNIFSEDAFRDAKLQNTIDSKISEYAPFIFSNRNQRELMNYLENAKKLLNQKKKDFGVTDRTEKIKAPKVEADVIDIKTGKKAEGIETLKDELGLPKGVTPKSPMGKNLQQLKQITKETELQKKDIEETLDKGLEDILKKELGKSGGLSANVLREGTRRPIIRQILAEDEEFRKMLSTEDYDDLLFGKDLDKGGDPNKDPLQYLNKFFERDIDQLDLLDDLIDTMPGSTPAEISAEFKKRTGGLKLKNKKTVEDFRDEGDLDPGGMAEGGRPGKGIDYLMGM